MKIIKSRLFKIIVTLFILGLFLGIISFILSDKDHSIINYFSLLNSGNYNYISSFIYSIINNYKYSFIMFFLGISLIFVFIIPFIIIFRGISASLTIISIIYTYKIKGLIIALILMFPVMIINELIFIFFSYYSINFSIKEYNVIKNNKSINLKDFIKNYLYIFLLSLVLLFISSLFEIFISSNIIKFVI